MKPKADAAAIVAYSIFSSHSNNERLANVGENVDGSVRPSYRNEQNHNPRVKFSSARPREPLFCVVRKQLNIVHPKTYSQNEIMKMHLLIWKYGVKISHFSQ